VSSAAFNDDRDKDPMSTYLTSVLTSLGRQPTSVVNDYPGYGLVWFLAEVPRHLQQLVARDPQPDDPAHSVIVGNKTKPVKRGLRDASQWLVRINKPVPQD
jgi:hypothetical protein